MGLSIAGEAGEQGGVLDAPKSGVLEELHCKLSRQQGVRPAVGPRAMRVAG
jgi:hypothetical protein